MLLFLQVPAAANLLARHTCPPGDTSATEEQQQAATQEYERLLTHYHATISSSSSEAVAAAGDAVAKSREQLSLTYSLYVGYLHESLVALMADAEGVEGAAGVARQLLKVLKGAHEGGAAGVELYRTWGEVAMMLQQPKVCAVVLGGRGGGAGVGRASCMIRGLGARGYCGLEL